MMQKGIRITALVVLLIVEYMTPISYSTEIFAEDSFSQEKNDTIISYEQNNNNEGVGNSEIEQGIEIGDNNVEEIENKELETSEVDNSEIEQGIEIGDNNVEEIENKGLETSEVDNSEIEQGIEIEDNDIEYVENLDNTYINNTGNNQYGKLNDDIIIDETNGEVKNEQPFQLSGDVKDVLNGNLSGDLDNSIILECQIGNKLKDIHSNNCSPIDYIFQTNVFSSGGNEDNLEEISVGDSENSFNGLFSGNVESLTGDELIISQAWQNLNTEPIIKSEIYNHVTVTVEAPVGTFPEDVELKINPVVVKSDLNEIKENIIKEDDTVLENSDVIAFDIKFIYQLNEEKELELQPKENTVKVMFDYSENESLKNLGEEQEIKLFHIEETKDENGLIDDMVVNEMALNQTESTENLSVLDANSFSIYAIIASNQTANITITYDANGGVFSGGGASKSVIYKKVNGQYEAQENTQAPNREGYMFDGWYTSTNGNTQRLGINSDTTTTTKTVYAKWLEFSDLEVNLGVYGKIKIMDRNLGATSVDGDGKYFQWGNNFGFTAGWSQQTSSSINISNKGYGPNNYFSRAVFRSGEGATYSWFTDTTEGYKNLWGGNSNSNSDLDKQGPCPEGYHIPSMKEWTRLYTMYITNNNINNSAQASFQFFTNTLHMPVASRLGDSNAALKSDNVGTYWSVDTKDAKNAYGLSFSSNASIDWNYTDYHLRARPIRCFKNTEDYIVSINRDGIDYSTNRIKRRESLSTSYKPSAPANATETRYKDSDFTEVFTFSDDTYITGDTVIYSQITCNQENYKWNGEVCDNPIALTFDANGGRTEVGTVFVGEGAKINLSKYTAAQTGYIFIGWSKTDTGENIIDEIILTGNTTLYAHYQADDRITTIQFVDEDSTELYITTGAVGSYISTPENPTKFGYIFNGWEPSIPFAMPAENMTVVATWLPLIYNVTFNANRGSLGGNTQTPVTYNYGEKVTKPANNPTRSNYTFLGWYRDTNAGTVWDFSTDTVTEDVTLYASWVSGTRYVITFNSNGGSIVNPIYGSNGGRITMPEDPTREGYTFEGWYSNEGLTTKFTRTAFNQSNYNLYAKWTLKDYNITYDLDGGINSANNPSTYTIETGETDFSNPTKDNATFGGWYKTSTDEKITSFGGGMTGDISVKAKWIYSVNYYDGDTLLNSVTGTSNDIIAQPTNPTKAGYRFLGWYSDPQLTVSYDFGHSLTKNINIYSAWIDANCLFIKFDTDGGTYVNYMTGTVGTEILNLPTTTKSGYTFLGWYTYTGQKVNSISLNQDTILYAHWESDLHMITFLDTDGSELYVVEGVTGSPVTVPENPTKIGHRFDGWDPVVPSQIPAENLTVVATWSPLSYSVTFDANGGNLGENTQTPVTYNYGDKIIKPANNPTRSFRLLVTIRYPFYGWSDNDGCNEYWDFSTNTVEGNMTLYACWGSSSDNSDYIITFNSNGGSTINPIHGSNNSNITMPADPTREGYIFEGWYSDEGFTTEFTKTKFDGNYNLYAKWTPINYNITYDLDGGINSANNPSTYTIETKKTNFSNPTKDDAEFGWWYKTSTDEKITSFGGGKMGDISVKAKWIYSVNYYDGDILLNSVTGVANDIIVQPLNPFKAGYEFLGWYKDSAFQNQRNFDTDVVTSNVTLYAKWNKLRCWDLGNQYSGVVWNCEEGIITITSGAKVRRLKDANVGATDVGFGINASIDSYGLYYQWGGITGYNYLMSASEAIAAGFNTNNESYSANVLNTDEWSAHLCPSGYHIGTKTEWQSLLNMLDANGVNNISSKIEALKIPFAGGRDSDADVMISSDAYLWSTSSDGDDTAYDAYISSDGVEFYSDGRNNAYSVRCFEDVETYTVSFETNSGTVINDIQVEEGDPVPQPVAPIKIGHTFDGWYTDRNLTELFNFSDPLTGNITIYAKRINSEPVSIYAPSMIKLPNITVPKNLTVINLNIDDYFSVKDPIGSENGWNTTIEVTDLSGSLSVIDKSKIYLKAGELETVGDFNEAVHINQNLLDGYLSIGNPVNYIYRTKSTNHKTGEYRNKLSLRVLVPGYQPSDVYSGKLVVTLYEN